jgi:hypothetical protein
MFALGMRPRLALVSPAVLDGHGDTIGTQYVEMGKALLPSADCVLAVPAAPACDAGLPIAPYSSEPALRAIVDSADVVLVPVSCFAIFPTLAATPARLIVDLHQPVPEADRALRAGDFFLCGSEAERDRWLRILVTRHRISRTRYRRNQDLRKLIDVIDAGDRREATRRNHATPEPSRWDRLVDPVRLYCTRTAREPRGAAWAPRSIAGARFTSSARVDFERS